MSHEIAVAKREYDVQRDKVAGVEQEYIYKRKDLRVPEHEVERLRQEYGLALIEFVRIKMELFAVVDAERVPARLAAEEWDPDSGRSGGAGR